MANHNLPIQEISSAVCLVRFVLVGSVHPNIFLIPYFLNQHSFFHLAAITTKLFFLKKEFVKHKNLSPLNWQF